MNNIRSAVTCAFVTLLTATTASAQTPPATFEVASIKPSPPGDPANPISMVPIAAPQPGGRFKASNVPPKMLIGLALDFQDFNNPVTGGPAELMCTRVDITASTAGGVTRSHKAVT